jgi:hypothetical protein
MSNYSNVSTSLTEPFLTSNEVSNGVIFNLKILLLACLIVLSISCLMSCFTSVSSCCNGKCSCVNCECDCNCQGNCGSKYEHFGNDQFFSYKDTVNPGYFVSQEAELTSPDQNLIFGSATKIINPVGDVNTFYLQLRCSLYVLNGNPFINTLIDEHYQVYLSSNDNDKREFVGRLNKDNDGVYKLMFKSTDIEKYSGFNNIIITFLYNGTEKTILNNTFFNYISNI